MPRRMDTPGRQVGTMDWRDATDKQIDPLVYGLYGLTDDESRIVVEGTR